MEQWLLAAHMGQLAAVAQLVPPPAPVVPAAPVVVPIGQLQLLATRATKRRRHQRMTRA
jgi:hypothetical protein